MLATAATLGFLALLTTINYIHVHWLRVDVVFYAAIGDAVLATLVTSAMVWLSRRFSDFGLLEKLQLTAIWLLIGYALAISLPTVIDRSLSFYILEKLAQRGGAIRQDAFPRIFTDEYMAEHHLVDVRLTEQLQSGTIVIDHGCVRLTDKGRRIAAFSRAYRINFLPKHRLLMGQYTDALTDPFRNSAKPADYSCQQD